MWTKADIQTDAGVEIQKHKVNIWAVKRRKRKCYKSLKCYVDAVILPFNLKQQRLCSAQMHSTKTSRTNFYHILDIGFESTAQETYLNLKFKLAFI